MRFSIVTSILILFFSGCKNNSNSVAPVDQSLSVSIVRDSLQYTLEVPKTVFGVHDTLIASMTVYNQSMSTDTLYLQGGSSYYNGRWTLNKDSTRTIMFGPKGPIPLIIVLFPLASHKTLESSIIHEVIADTSGAAVTPGSYTLQAQFYGLTFKLNISLQ